MIGTVYAISQLQRDRSELLNGRRGPDVDHELAEREARHPDQRDGDR